jgi:hypothetical protein
MKSKHESVLVSLAGGALFSASTSGLQDRFGELADRVAPRVRIVGVWSNL